LGRGTGDDLAARLRRPAVERQRQTQLQAQLRLLQTRLEKLAVARALSPTQKQQRERLLDEQLRAQDELARFSREVREKYGPVGGQVLDVTDLQKALPADGAFLAWLDFKGEHWAVLLKAKGGPVWARLPGSGPDKAWTAADGELPAKVES